MLPGGARDRFISVARVAFPAAATVLFITLVALPLSMTHEFSFLLSKDNAARSGERLSIQEASYRGQTNAGEPFSVTAGSAVQKSSTVPVVMLEGLAAAIERADGTAAVTAPGGEFLLDENRILVDGPVVGRSDAGYTVDGGTVYVDLNTASVDSSEPVSGNLPMGSFRANSFRGSLDGSSIILDGGAHLRMIPNRSGS